MRWSCAALLFLLSGCAAPSVCGESPIERPFSTREFSFVDATRATMPNGSFPGASTRTLPVTLWLPDGDGPWPLVVHSHGFSDTRLGESWFAEGIARAGYAVAALDFPLSNFNAPGGPTVFDVANQPADLAFVIASLLASDAAPRLDARRVALSGLSLGGLTTLLATYHPTLGLVDIRAALVMAPVACFFTEAYFAGASVPLAVVHGDNDVLIPYEEHGRLLFTRARQPGLLATIAGGTHLGFSNLGATASPTSHPDEIGCAFVPRGAPMFDGLGGSDVGIASGQCPSACEGQGVVPALDGVIQQEESVRAARAFLSRYLRGDAPASCRMPTSDVLTIDESRGYGSGTQ